MVLSLQGIHEAGLPGHESAAQEAGGEDQGHGPQEGRAVGAPGHGLHIQQVSPFLSLAVSLFLSLSHTHTQAATSCSILGSVGLAQYRIFQSFRLKLNFTLKEGWFLVRGLLPENTDEGFREKCF